MTYHPDTHKAAILWEARNRMVGSIPRTVVAALSDALRMGFAPMTAVIEVEHMPWHSSVVLGAQLRTA